MEAYYVRGFSKGALKDYQGAIADCNIAIEIDSKCASAYYVRGIAKIQLKQKEGGCIDLSKAGELGYEEAYDIIKEHCQ
ncbi:MAG: hypothetical protein ABIJ97_13235 [Bacteroidota bacterium]